MGEGEGIRNTRKGSRSGILKSIYGKIVSAILHFDILQQKNHRERSCQGRGGTKIRTRRRFIPSPRLHFCPSVYDTHELTTGSNPEPTCEARYRACLLYNCGNKKKESFGDILNFRLKKFKILPQ